MFKDYICYSDKVIKILKHKQPNIKFNSFLIRIGFGMNYTPIAIAIADVLIRIYNTEVNLK